jgi:hypothetical protein
METGATAKSVIIGRGHHATHKKIKMPGIEGEVSRSIPGFYYPVLQGRHQAFFIHGHFNAMP